MRLRRRGLYCGFPLISFDEHRLSDTLINMHRPSAQQNMILLVIQSPDGGLVGV